jgi:hypothetical protein
MKCEFGAARQQGDRSTRKGQMKTKRAFRFSPERPLLD